MTTTHEFDAHTQQVMVRLDILHCLADTETINKVWDEAKAQYMNESLTYNRRDIPATLLRDCFENALDLVAFDADAAREAIAARCAFPNDLEGEHDHAICEDANEDVEADRRKDAQDAADWAIGHTC